MFGLQIENGHFYFIKDDFYELCQDDTLPTNKGEGHGRPCFFAFVKDGYCWMIPITSRLDKFKALAVKKQKRYGKCDTILFGEVLGHEKAFLVQNMFPALEQFIESEYVDKLSNIPVRIDKPKEEQIIKTAMRVLSKQEHGVKLIFTDVERIKRVIVQRESR
jgi:hypothetical protein